MSSRGEMKISLRLMTFIFVRPFLRPAHLYTDIFMSEMLEKLQFSVSSLGEDRCAKGLHNLLDSHGLVCELVLRRAGAVSVPWLNSF